MKNESTGKRPIFRFFPEERMYPDYPWQIWTVGLLLFLKAVLWFSSDPNIPDTVLKILGYKYTLFMIPSIVLGLGIWNLRRWATWGIVILSIVELLFFIVYPSSLLSLRLDHTSLIALVLSFFVFLINGPASDIFILITTRALFKNTDSTSS